MKTIALFEDNLTDVKRFYDAVILYKNKANEDIKLLLYIDSDEYDNLEEKFIIENGLAYEINDIYKLISNIDNVKFFKNNFYENNIDFYAFDISFDFGFQYEPNELGLELFRKIKLLNGNALFKNYVIISAYTSKYNDLIKSLKIDKYNIIAKESYPGSLIKDPIIQKLIQHLS